ncbi:zinc finger protein 98 isoform X2 [Nilaparvata lugens]|nr:zinc finger protein 98 isoform X2 [Nilaparvata lugens]
MMLRIPIVRLIRLEDMGYQQTSVNVNTKNYDEPEVFKKSCIKEEYSTTDQEFRVKIEATDDTKDPLLLNKENIDADSKCKPLVSVTMPISVKREHESYPSIENVESSSNFLQIDTVQGHSDRSICDSEEGNSKRVQYEEKQFECDLCDKVFSQNSLLNDHINIHSGKKGLKCEFCDKSFSRRSSLKGHVKIHTGDSPFLSENCDRRSPPKSRLKNRKPLSRKNSLKGPVMKHTKEFPFQKENFDKMSLNSGLENHARSKTFKCEFCNKILSIKGKKLHIMIHTGERPFQCEHCSKCFLRKSHLFGHIRIHTGEKPIQCQCCARRFRLDSALRKHMRIHTGERPFECEFCDYSFSQKIVCKNIFLLTLKKNPLNVNFVRNVFRVKLI